MAKDDTCVTSGNSNLTRRLDIKYLFALLLAVSLLIGLIKVVQASPAPDINKSMEQHQSVDAESVYILTQAQSPAAVPYAVRQETVKPPVVNEPVLPEPETPKSYAHAEVLKRGWGEEQWLALEQLWTKESNWRPEALNSTSGACGIPQALPCAKIPDWTNYRSQIDWGLSYIASRYMTPVAALNFWLYSAPLHNGSHWY